MSIRLAALTALSLFLLTPSTPSQANRVIELQWIRGSAGRYDGPAAGDMAGRGLSAAGDVNGDGHDDFMVSGYDVGFLDGPGRVWLVYGSAYGLPESAVLGADVTLLGNQNADRTGISLAAAGDVNGDGYDDVLIGASRWDSGTAADVGRAYLVFGGPSLPSTIALAGLTPSTGVFLQGAAFSELTGERVAGLGDVNGDGLPDLLITAPGAAPGGLNLAGKAYIVYGGPGLAPLIDLTTLSAADGVTIAGLGAGDLWGSAAAAAGDVDGDGYADALIASYLADPPGKVNAGQAAIVFGGPALAAAIDLAALAGAGVLIGGETPGDALAFSASGGGDVNGDGYDDVLLGAKEYAGGVGRAYLVYGGPSLPSSLDVGTLGSGGVVLTGEFLGDEVGHAVALGGDSDKDGYADFVIGALNADGGGSSSGEVYAVHGGPALPANISLGALSWRGEQVNGAVAGDRVGETLAFLGDVDDDGFGDFGLGTRFADVSGLDAGAAWVLPGGCKWLLAEGGLAEGDTFVMHAIGSPGSQWLNYLSAGRFAAPLPTSKGPFWLTDPLLSLGVLTFDADGQLSFPVTIPTGMGLSGLSAYWQFVEQPKGWHCDLSRLLTTTVE